MLVCFVSLHLIDTLFGFAASTRLSSFSDVSDQRKLPWSTLLASVVPPYIPDTSPAIQDMLKLLGELECEGVEADDSAVEIGFGSTTGMRGVFAKEDLGVGEFLFAVPFPATLVVMEDEDELTTDAYRGLMLLRKYLEPSAETQRWRPYLDSLPTIDYCFTPTPDFWSHDEIQLLEFPRLVREALNRKEQIRQLAAEEGVDCDKLQFATWLAKSRCFSILKVREGRMKTKSVLIPFFDMVNHSSDQPNAALQLVEAKADDESFYTIITTCPIPAGTEVTISYGTSSDSSVEHLMNYGLLEESNRYDIDMLHYGGEGCLNRMEYWSTSLEDDERELLTAMGNAKVALAFRVRMKQAIRLMKF